MNSASSYDRINRHNDFQEMDLDPIIHSALDIYAEETVSPDDNGDIIHIFSENRKIKDILEFLFYETLNVQFFLSPWVRSMCKFGDVYLLLDVRDKIGVCNVFPIPVNEIEREEGFDQNNPAAVRFRWQTNGNRLLDDYEIAHFRLLGEDTFLPYGSSVLSGARRIWRMVKHLEDNMMLYRVVRSPERRVFYIDTGNIAPEKVPDYMEEVKRTMTTNPVVNKNNGEIDLRHNALTSLQDYYLPIKDGSQTRIETLAGGRHATDIDDIEYMQRQLFAALKIPKAYLTYEEELCLHPDTKIPLLDGRTITIKEIAEEYENEKQNWVYSSELDGSVKPGKILWAGKTKICNKLLEITLDNNEKILCTENHPFLLRTGKYKRADELICNEGIMPLYRKLSNKKEKDFANGYEKILNNSTNKWVYTHRMVANNEKINIHESAGTYIYDVIHHNTFDKLKNYPEHLTLMSNRYHFQYHGKMASERTKKFWENDNGKLRKKIEEIKKTEEYRQKISNGNKKAWSRDNGSRRKKQSELLTELNKKSWENDNYRQKKLKILKTDEHKQKVSMGIRKYWNNNDNENRKKMSVGQKKQDNPNWKPRPKLEDLIELVKKGVSEKFEARDILNCSLSGIDEILFSNEIDGWCDLICKFGKRKKGGKIKSIDLNYASSISATSKNRLDFYKKIGISKKGFGNYFKRNNLNLFKWFKENLNKINHKIISIKTIILSEPIEVYDLTIDKYNNFALDAGVFVHNSSKAGLSQQDLRFNRTINHIQKTVISELNKIATIHLVAHGFADEEILNFDLKLSNPSALAEQQKLELLRSKFEIISTPEPGYFSRDWLRRKVMGLTQEEIEEIDRELRRDKLFEVEMEDINLPGGEGGGGGGFGAPGGGIGAEFGDDDLGMTPAPDETGGGLEAPEGELGGDEREEEKPEEEEGEEDLFAGDEKEVGGKKKLLMASDNDEEIFLDEEDEEENKKQLKLSIQDEDAPIKAMNQMQRVFHNRNRKRRHGPKALDMPDFNSMLSYKNKSHSDPYDKEFLKNPNRETFKLSDGKVLGLYYDKKIAENEKIASKTLTMLDNLKKKLKLDNRKIIITENEETKKEEKDLEEILKESIIAGGENNNDDNNQ